MKKVKFTKETLAISLILILSAVLNFENISIQGYSNKYYAAGVKSMLMSFKNFFFVSFDPAGFVTIDKPPVGFWIQTISAKIFGFSGWSIVLPQALAGVISVGLVYYLVKRSFGTAAGLISALCLAVTPVFVATSRNNTIDNLLVMTLLFSCWALSIAAEKGKFKYLIISLVLVGVGFNIKMLQAYMIGPALYITYLLSTAISFKKKIIHLVVGSFLLAAVSLSWALIVDLVPAQNRPFVGSSTNNTVKELIFGHNGLNRIIGGSRGGDSGNQRRDGQSKESTSDSSSTAKENVGTDSKGNVDGNSGVIQGNNTDGGQGQGMAGGPPDGQGSGGMGPGDGNMQPPNGGGQGGQSGLQGSFGAETPAGITRLFSKNTLSDQIVWFLPLALFGFVAAAIKEKLQFPFDNKRKLSLILWILWLLPEFIYFSYSTGLFHPYYLTMMAPPIAALTGIGITSAWELYKEGGWKSWILPGSPIAGGLTQVLMLSYFTNIPSIFRNIILVSLVLCFASSAILGMLNIVKNKKLSFSLQSNSDNLRHIKKITKVLASIAFIGLIVAPAIGASAPIFHKITEGIPTAGLGLLSSSQRGNFGGGGPNDSSSNTKLIQFLKSNKTTEKYLLVVSASGEADNIIINTGESVMAFGGFSGNDKILTLDQFKEMVSKGEVRYVMSGGMGGRGSGSDIMNWVKENGKVVAESEWKDSNGSNSNVNNSQEQKSDSGNQRFGGGNSQQLYDLKK